MTSPQPPSLATILSLDPNNPNHEANANVDGPPDESALLDYLKDTYANEEVNIDQNAYNGRQKAQSGSQGPSAAHQMPRPRSPSPPDATVKIDPALAEIASRASHEDIPDVPQPSFWLPDHQREYGALGEMGGKRKKLPHERAGWKEMDEAGPRKRGPRKGNQAQETPFVGPSTTGDGGAGASKLERDLIEAHRQNSGLEGGDEDGHLGMYRSMGILPPASASDQGVTGNGNTGHESGEASDGDGLAKKRKRDPEEAKEARAEQNRRAQQAFRRRREEKMKGLEAAAAALEPTQRRLMEVETKLVDASLALEASKIQCQALQAALRVVAQSSGHSVITDEGTLAINSSLQLRKSRNTAREIDEACETLARQARELAKQNRSRRGY